MASIFQGRRTLKLLPIGVTVAVLAAAVLVVSRPDSTAQATSGADPYSVPAVVDVNADPHVVETTIVAREATVDIGGGVMAKAMTFNGAIPGPEIRVTAGDLVIVHFENRLQEVTGIHWHGIELSAVSDGTPLTQNGVEPGSSYLYRFEVPRPGVFWYHPHGHGATNQVFKGMYGSLIASDPAEPAVVAAGALPGPEATETMMLADTTVCKEPGKNDTRTHDPSLPWLGTATLPNQPGPTPATLCDTPMDNDGNPILDANGDPVPRQEGDIPNVQPVESNARVNEGQTVLTNGMNVGGRSGRPDAPDDLSAGAATLDVRPGQGIRFQLVNAATVRYFHLRLTTSTGAQIPLVRVGGEGGLLDAGVVEGGDPNGFETHFEPGEIVIAPGERADVVAAIPPNATGVATLWTIDFFRTGLGFVNLPTVPVAHLNVTGPATNYTIGAGTPILNAVGASVPTLGPPSAPLLDPALFTAPKPGSPNQNIRMTTENFVLGIDNVEGIHDATDYQMTPHLASTRYAKIGDTLELSVTNVTSANHPFHLHGFSFQPLSFTKPGAPSYVFPYREFVDEVDVPPTYTLTFRVLLEDRPLMDGVTPGGGLGRWVFHCHIFFHNTGGMTAELVVVKDATGNEKPNINADEAWARTRAGDAATMTGIFNDLDGDPVALSASVGSVTDSGNGRWTWTHTPSAVSESQTVYVTATDAAGNQGQHGFDLVVRERRPVAGDFDDDGTADIGVFRPANGYWFLEGGGPSQWGTSGDIPVPGDYNLDGNTERAVFRPSTGTWFVEGGPTVVFGAEGDIPVPGDYDGDDDTDIAVFRPSTGVWFIENGPTIVWGTSGDIPVPGDYDGDGDTDVAVFRPSTGVWFVNGGPAIVWGTSGDIPVPGDYDGDGDTDVAVFRAAHGYWFVNGAPIVQFGTAGDVPLLAPPGTA
jgi:FtsP/CotA-like multicopper oxidase with cupredoxin domain